MRRRSFVIAGVLAVLALTALGGVRLALHSLRESLAGALGPGATVGSVDLGLRRLAVSELAIPGDAEWPAEAALRAERLSIAPSLRSLFSGQQVEVGAVDVTAPYVSMLRTRGGRLRVVPTLLEERSRGGEERAPPAAASADEPPPRAVRLGRLQVTDGEVDLYDASIATPPWRIRLIGVQALLESVTVPTPSGRSTLDVRATIDGPARDGTVAVSGWIDATTTDLDLTARLRGVDLLAFRPYVSQASKERLQGGTFDLDLHATVRGGRLSAPGHVVLVDLALHPGRRGSDRVFGVPRDLLMAALAEHGELAFDFHLDGDVTDPRFSLNETLGGRLAAGLLQKIGGVSVRGLVEGVDGLGGATLRGAETLERGVGAALKGLLPRR